MKDWSTGFLTLCALLFVSASCSREAEVQPRPPPSNFPISSDLNSSSFATAINEANGSALTIIRDLRKEDFKPEPIQEEFETTQEFEQRIREFENRPPYGPGFRAIVYSADFSYDADKNIVTIFYCSTSSDTATPCVHSAWGRSDTILQLENLQIIPVGATPPPSQASFTMPVEKARSLPAHRLRLALIISVEGLRPPVLRSNRWLDSSIFDDFDNPILAMNNDPRWNQAFYALNGTNFTLSAHVVRIIAFDLDEGGAEHPLFQWTAKSQ